ncbi:hypothetical protein [Shimazuella kribbensis]|uniref:hypothetical protein n=1 Tax=Shimazuella kribbensis TaxID=139808 RepID=UPI0003F557CA|nr:hypothetical protein [Shimazuella kribbensis]
MMKQQWQQQELIEQFTIIGSEQKLIDSKSNHMKIGFIALLKYFQQCQIRVNQKKDRIVPFPFSFKETLTMHTENMRKRMLPIYLNQAGKRNTWIVGYARYSKSILIK